MDASNLIKPELARGTLHCIGATTLDEYRKHIEKDAALARRFQPVFVGEPSVEDTISILRGIKEKYETHHGVRITDGALVAAATLSNRYITDRFLPDKAIDLIDEASSRLRMEVDQQAGGAGRARSPRHPVEDRARGAAEGERCGVARAVGAAGEGAGRPGGQVQRDDRRLEGGEGAGDGPAEAEGAAGPGAERGGGRAAPRRSGDARRSCCTASSRTSRRSWPPRPTASW